MMYNILYKETYVKVYSREADSVEEAEDMLADDLIHGREEAPDECCHSFCITYPENTKERLSKRRVLITSGMSDDAILFITDAPVDALKEWCRSYNKALEDGKNIFLDPLKKKYYVNLLVDSEINDGTDDIDIIGYDEQYDLDDYMEE